MARRTKKTPVVETPAAAEVAPEAPSAPQEPVRKVLSRAELDGMARWVAEIRLADAHAELRERDRLALIARIDPNGELAALARRMEAVKANRATASSKYLSIVKAASERLGVDVTAYGYDDETGVLSLRPKE